MHYRSPFSALLKSTFILSPLLGVTWVVGLLAVNNYTTVFAWLFCFLNAFQVSVCTVCTVCTGNRGVQSVQCVQPVWCVQSVQCIQSVLCVQGIEESV